MMKIMLLTWLLITIFLFSGCTILGFEASSTETSTTVEDKELKERVADLEKRVDALEKKSR